MAGPLVLAGGRFTGRRSNGDPEPRVPRSPSRSSASPRRWPWRSPSLAYTECLPMRWRGGGTRSASVWRWARTLARCAACSFGRAYFSRRSVAFWDSSPQRLFRAGSRHCSMVLRLSIRSRMQSQVRPSQARRSLRAPSLPAAPLLSIPCRRSAASDRRLLNEAGPKPSITKRLFWSAYIGGAARI
jgi:hypothetical protein